MLLRIKNPSKRRASMRPSFRGMIYFGEWMNVSVVRGGALPLPYSSFLALMQEKKQKKIKASAEAGEVGQVHDWRGRDLCHVPDKLPCLGRGRGQFLGLSDGLSVPGQLPRPRQRAFSCLDARKEAKENQGLCRGRGSWPGT